MALTLTPNEERIREKKELLEVTRSNIKRNTQNKSDLRASVKNLKLEIWDLEVHISRIEDQLLETNRSELKIKDEIDIIDGFINKLIKNRTSLIIKLNQESYRTFLSSKSSDDKDASSRKIEFFKSRLSKIHDKINKEKKKKSLLLSKLSSHDIEKNTLTSDKFKLNKAIRIKKEKIDQAQKEIVNITRQIENANRYISLKVYTDYKVLSKRQLTAGINEDTGLIYNYIVRLTRYNLKSKKCSYRIVSYTTRSYMDQNAKGESIVETLLYRIKGTSQKTINGFKKTLILKILNEY